MSNYRNLKDCKASSKNTRLVVSTYFYASLMLSSSVSKIRDHFQPLKSRYPLWEIPNVLEIILSGKFYQKSVEISYKIEPNSPPHQRNLTVSSPNIFFLINHMRRPLADKFLAAVFHFQNKTNNTK